MSTSPCPDWLETAIKDPAVTDICLNGIHSAFLDRGQGLEPIGPVSARPEWNPEQMRTWVLEQITRAGKSWDAKHPFIDANLSLNETAFRLHVAFPPLSQRGILVSLRRLPKPSPRSARTRWQDSEHFELLSRAYAKGDSILISGATGSGKTTLATDLLQEVPCSQRIIALEDTAELAPDHPHFLTLLSRPPNADGFGEVTLRTLLRQALRMRPDRLVLGECRGPEVLDLLQTLNTGHQGALATLHANSPRDALRRTELLCLLSAQGVITSSAIRELLSVGLQWVVQVKREAGKRFISEVVKIEGKEGDTILLRRMTGI
jgi:pilus assembly protein CpaF